MTLSGRILGISLARSCTALLLCCLAATVPLAQAERALLMPRAAQSLLLDIARAGERLVAVGERGHVLYSDDHGRNWTQVEVPTARMLTSVWFADERRGWAVGHDGMIIASVDGGNSWTLQRDGMAQQAALNRLAHEQAAAELARLEREDAAADVLEEARFALEDAAAVLDEPLYAPPLMDVWFGDAGHGVAVGAYGLYLETRDGGRNWQDRSARLDNPDGAHLYAIASPGNGRLLLVGETGSMFRSLDGGLSWQTLSPAYAGTLFGALAEPGSGRVCVFGLQGNILLSQDFGDSWMPLDSSTEVVLSGGTRTAAGEWLIAGSVGTLLRVDAGGRHVAVSATGSLGGNYSALAEAADGATVLVGQGGAMRLDGADAMAQAASP
jgi:photosystem II stability/assembly factor-like uncharacterized protein